MKYLVTGGCGFLGSNICAELLRVGNSLAVIDNLSRAGAESNLDWLRTQGEFEFSAGDIRAFETVSSIVERFQPDVVFHFAGQVAMTTSIQDPRYDFEVNLLGSFNLLEAIRTQCPEAVAIYSSSNKVYGDLGQLVCEEHSRRYLLRDCPNGVSETVGLEFHSPYGCSKGGADQYFLDYARIYGLSTIVFRHSSMYGGRQYSTIDQGWIGWFCQQALLQSRGVGAEFTVSGNGKQVRDVLHAHDMVSLYLLAASSAANMRGQAFNIGGGVANSLSILELLDLLEAILGIRLVRRHIAARESDQRVFVADLSRIRAVTGWAPQVGKEQGIRMMLDWVGKQDAIGGAGRG